jgi:hypothetical protein
LAFNKPLPNPLPNDDAAAPTAEPRPNSRRLNANAVHINGAAPGTSPEPPEANHDNKPPPTPPTEPDAAAGTAITGTSAGAALVAAEPPAAGATDTAAAAATRPEAEAPEDTSPAAALDACAAGAAGADSPTGTPTGPEDPADDGTSGDTDDEGAAESPETTSPERASRSTRLPAEPLPARRAAGLDGSATGLSPTPSAALPAPAEESTDPRDTRPGRRTGPLPFDAEADADDADDEPAESDPVEPAEPVVSANATGIAAAAEPIPNATANAPTRPTNRAKPPSAEESADLTAIRL